MRRAVVLLALVAGCVDKPGGFGVNVEVITSALDDTTRGQLATLGLHVRGAEKFDKTSIGDVTAAIKSGSVKFHYVPGVHAGTLSFEIDGLDAAGTIVASGAAPPVALVDGQAVDTTVTVAPGQHNGQPGVACTSADTCGTGLCVDGVCCDTDCSGRCEACNVAGSEGTCAPIPNGSDPEKECPAKALMLPDDLGVDDAGNPIIPDGGFLFPDGGATLDSTQCAGACNGARACAYPGATKSCGPAFCSAAAQQATFVCDGSGACGQALNACGDYACSTDMCKAQCLDNNDCAPTDFCDVNQLKCVPKRSDGQTCSLGFQCKSNFCISSVCCNADCSMVPGGTCNMPSKEGQCLCSVSCPMGVSCQLFYKDADGDGHGDDTATIGNGKAQVACANAAPAGFVATKDDCDDTDPNAHPGQTAFFQTQRASGGYDYDCNGTPDTQYNLYDVNLASYTCGFCLSTPFPGCGCNKQTQSNGSGHAGRLTCGFLCGLSCNKGAAGSYMFNSACGTGTNNYRTCDTATAAMQTGTQTVSSVPMACR